MKKIRNFVFGGLQQKIFNLVLFSILLIMIIVTAASFYETASTRDVLNEAAEEQKTAISGIASQVMDQTAQETLTHNTELESYIVDTLFTDIKGEVMTLANYAASLYTHADRYGARPVAFPDPSRDGTLQLQLVTEEGVDVEDPAVAAEIGLFGNMEDMMYGIYQSKASVGSCFIAFPDGVFLIADELPSVKYKDGARVYMPVTDRFWYKGAIAEGSVYFSDLQKDMFTDRTGIVCAAPVYAGGELVAVVGTDVFLDVLKAAVEDTAKNAGFVCIIDENGRVIFSPQKEGIFAPGLGGDGQDLRILENEALASFIKEAMTAKTQMQVIEADGRVYCVAGAPIGAMGWCLVTVVEEAILHQPADALLESYDSILRQASDKAALKSSRSNRTVLILLIAAMFMALAAALTLAKKIVAPLEGITKRIGALNGSDPAFVMDDAYRTGDEIEVLAESFASLSSKTRRYISHITEITAEKERIGTELALAQKIQADMLPNIFPPFPERKDLDIYAYMKPAKEVGGDFYDFFLVDEDHLALVMADVSGKGIPAALFMMMSKILLNTNTMLSASPREVLEKVNEQICRNNEEEMFVTVWLSILTISTGRIVAANAGHEYPILRKAGGEFEVFKDRHSFVVGGMKGTRYREYEMTLEKGGTLFLYTDGVAEATNDKDELFGTERMLSALNSDPDADAYHVLVNMNNAVGDFVGEAPQFDDLTMLAIRRP